MKARTNSAIAVGALAGGAVVLAFATLVLFVEGLGLRSELARLRAEAGDAQRSRDAAETELALHREQLAELRGEVTALREASAGEDSASPDGPIRARIVRGNQVVGVGWVVTSTNALNGQPEVSVVVENPVAPPPTTGGTTEPASALPVSPVAQYAYWYRTPYTTWGTLVGNYPEDPSCTNSHPGFAPPPAPADSTPPPSVVPPAVSPSPAPRTQLVPVSRRLPIRQVVIPPVTPTPPPYRISAPMASAPVAVGVPSGGVGRTPVRPAVVQPTPLPVRVPAARIQPVPSRPL